MRVFAGLLLLAGTMWGQTDPVERLLADLTNAFGPTGYEGPVRQVMRREMAPLVDRLETDGLGSLIAIREGPANAPKVMLAAHMDELGMIVRYITPDGFIKFQTLGGWLDGALINQRYIVQTRKGPVLAVSGLKTPHVMTGDERSRLRGRDSIFLDVGATSKQDAEDRLGIRPGDPIAPDSKFVVMAGGKRYLAKAWDDRVGLGVIVEAMRKLKGVPLPCSVYAVATVQEEVGLRGAHTATYQVRPDIGISLESGVAGDYPGISPDEAQERLGYGPGIFLHDSSMLPNLKLRDFFAQAASDKGIPLQYNVLSGYGEDGAEMQRRFAGIPAINFTVPTRYLHNHNGIIQRDDFDRAVELLVEVLKRLDAAAVARLKQFD
ncbi:MAG: M42 family metallopeptidase [Bryobacterales bacterium]|nr:M42 family metallopeptidase [Bryobacterales bacterium]